MPDPLTPRDRSPFSPSPVRRARKQIPSSLLSIHTPTYPNHIATMSTKSKPADASRRCFLKTDPCPPPHHMTRPPALNAGSLKPIPIIRAWVLGCLVCGLWQSGATAVGIYTDQTAFNAAVTGLVAEDFTSFDGFYASGLVVSVPGYPISASAPGGLYVSSGLFSTNNPGPLTFTFTGILPTAVGGLFFTTDASFNAVSSTITVSINDGTSFISLPAPTGGAVDLTGMFVGVTSAGGISSLTVGGPFSSTGNSYPTVNSLYVGPGPIIPEPSSFALISVIGLLGSVYRKRMSC